MDEKTPKLCLNMIVKNESKIIQRLLKSALPLLDSYCICDTGSTDNTVSLIETFFAENNIPGKIVREPFRDFGYNRSFALKQCEGLPNADYLLLVDADMILRINPKKKPSEIKNELVADSYFIYQGTDQFYYKNMRIVKNNQNVSYWGVTHEYVRCPDHFTKDEFDRSNLFILDIGDGGSKSDKFVRDIALLKKGLETLPDNDRYMFYLANSYRDHGDIDLAIETYKKRIKIGGWFEEIWYSYYSIGNCYKTKGDYANAIFYWMEGYDFFPDRVENIYEIIHYYRTNKKYKMAYPFYLIAAASIQKIQKLDFLFLKRDIYDYKLDYELSIIGYYSNPNNIDLSRISMKVMAYFLLEDNIFKNILSNYKFYSPKILEISGERTIVPENYELLVNVGKELMLPFLNNGEFLVSTPSICFSKNKKELVICQRFVNYKIKDDGSYENGEHITTKNVIAKIDVSKRNWSKMSEYFLIYDEKHDNKYEGLEDVRLIMQNDILYFNANRGLAPSNMIIEHGTIEGEHTFSNLIYTGNQKSIEKNWVIFIDPVMQKQKMIYKWSPITIGDVDPETNQFATTQLVETPYFFRHLRGSTNGVIIENEIWFICHMVSYEDRRYYYHIFVVIDATTYQLKKYSPLFTFGGEKVEYTLGFVHLNTNEFLIGYSVLDRKNDYMTIAKNTVDERMILA